MAGVVIVGAGLAGLRVIEELRARGYPGAVTLIGAEQRPPYDRPPLSKKVMTGELDDTSLRADLASLSVDVRLGETAVQLTDHVVRTDAAEYEFAALVATTGANPVRLPGDGPQRVLRTMDEALELRSLLKPGASLAIVGAGWIGAELATAAAARGCGVTVLEAAGTPLAAAIGTEVGGMTIPWYAEAGVELRLTESVTSIEAGGIALAGGGFVAADMVVTAVGVTAGRVLARRLGYPAGERRCRGRPTAHVYAERVRGRRLRVILVGQVWQAAPVRALGCRAARTGGRGREHSGREHRATTPFPISGPNSSAAWCSTWAGTVARTRWSGADGRPGRSGQCAGSGVSGWSRC